jgi:hypothetical protein
MTTNPNPAPFHPDFEQFMIELIEVCDTDALSTVSLRDAQRILDAMPEGMARDSLRDAFRDNIDAADDRTLF